MNLFRGRTEVFPKKWDNSKTTFLKEWIEADNITSSNATMDDTNKGKVNELIKWHPKLLLPRRRIKRRTSQTVGNGQ